MAPYANGGWRFKCKLGRKRTQKGVIETQALHFETNNNGQ